MSTDMVTMTLLMSVLALIFAVAALYLSSELARRTAEASKDRMDQTEQSLVARIEAQKKLANGMFDTMADKVGKIEKTVEAQNQTLKDIGQNIDQQLRGQHAAYNSGLTEISRSVATLEKRMNTQNRDMSALKKSVTANAAEHQPHSPSPVDELAARNAAQSVVTAPMPEQPVIRNAADDGDWDH